MSKTALRQILQAASQPVARFVSRAYVPGPQLSDAMRWARRFHASGVACTFGYFNADEDDAAAIAQKNLDAMDAMVEQAGAGYVSIKAPPLAYDAEILAGLGRRASFHGQWMHFDSHGPETAQPTIDAVESLRCLHPKVGLSIPGRWRRSVEDADWAASRGIRVRVVKGQWACPVQPDSDAKKGFLDVVDCLAGRAASVAIATHDAPLATQALTRLLAKGTRCELELLCGLPRQAPMAAARALGVPVRMYIPFGQAWLPYALGQAARNPKTLLWVLRDSAQALR
jgi:proline dehydrogenase